MTRVEACSCAPWQAGPEGRSPARSTGGLPPPDLARGIVTVSPGKGSLGTFAPRLDGAGNSTKGQLAARFLSRRLGLDLFISEPAR